jgi:hypothetical protein
MSARAVFLKNKQARREKAKKAELAKSAELAKLKKKSISKEHLEPIIKKKQKVSDSIPTDNNKLVIDSFYAKHSKDKIDALMQKIYADSVSPSESQSESPRASPSESPKDLSERLNIENPKFIELEDLEDLPKPLIQEPIKTECACVRLQMAKNLDQKPKCRKWIRCCLTCREKIHSKTKIFINCKKHKDCVLTLYAIHCGGIKELKRELMRSSNISNEKCKYCGKYLVYILRCELCFAESNRK